MINNSVLTRDPDFNNSFVRVARCWPHLAFAENGLAAALLVQQEFGGDVGRGMVKAVGERLQAQYYNRVDGRLINVTCAFKTHVTLGDLDKTYTVQSDSCSLAILAASRQLGAAMAGQAIPADVPDDLVLGTFQTSFASLAAHDAALAYAGDGMAAAFLVQRHFGGDIIHGPVLGAGETEFRPRYFNRLANGQFINLSCDGPQAAANGQSIFPLRKIPDDARIQAELLQLALY